MHVLFLRGEGERWRVPPVREQQGKEDPIAGYKAPDSSQVFRGFRGLGLWVEFLFCFHQGRFQFGNE